MQPLINDEKKVVEICWREIDRTPRRITRSWNSRTKEEALAEMETIRDDLNRHYLEKPNESYKIVDTRNKENLYLHWRPDRNKWSFLYYNEGKGLRYTHQFEEGKEHIEFARRFRDGFLERFAGKPFDLSAFWSYRENFEKS